MNDGHNHKHGIATLPARPSHSSTQSELSEQIMNLRQGDHLCLFYEKDPGEQLPALVPFIKESLTHDEQFIYIADDHSVEALTDRLVGHGVNVGLESRRGRLKLWTRQDWRQPGPLDSEKKSRQVRQFADEALAAGFKGIRFAVEMTWTLGPDISSSRLEHWEAKINTIFVPGFPGRIVCQYNQSRLSPEVLMAALHTHPVAILGEQVCPNPFYRAPLILEEGAKPESPASSRARAAATVDWMVSQLRRSHVQQKEREELIEKRGALAQAEAARVKTERVLESITDGFIALDPQGAITYVNANAAQFLGRRREVLASRNLWQEFPQLAGGRIH
jgi:PAS domain-containing protein